MKHFEDCPEWEDRDPDPSGPKWVAFIAIVMIACIAFVMSMVLVPRPAHSGPADPTVNSTPGVSRPIAGGQMALSVGTATTLTVPAGARWARICAETAAVRYRDDGSNATSANGIPVASGACIDYAGDLTAINFTAQSGSPTITVLYYK